MSLAAVAALGAAAFFAGGSTPAGASSCAPLELPGQLDKAVAVFRGRIVDLRPLRDAVGKSHVAIEMTVDRVYKGQVHRRQSLVTSAFSSRGIERDASGPLVVYAHRPSRSDRLGDQPPGVYAVNDCSYLSVNDADLVALGKGTKPIPGSSASASIPETELFAWARQWPGAAVVAVGVVALGASAVVLTRRRTA